MEIKERKLKNLYEKFCFLNHLTENMLSNKNVVSTLKHYYGYKFIPDTDSNKMFTKITKKKTIILPDI